MSRNNPRSNPRPKKTKKSDPAGYGEDADADKPPAPAAPKPEPPLAQHGVSETMTLIRRAVNHRWVIPEQVYVAAPAIVGRILLDPATDVRDKIRATQTLAMLDRNNTDLIVESHRIERLNDGMSTENVALVASMTDDQISAVAASIAASGKPKALP